MSSSLRTSSHRDSPRPGPVTRGRPRSRPGRGRRGRDAASVQLPLHFRSWGGARAGAGRKRRPSSGVAHVSRARVSRHDPIHVTLRLAPHVWNLRSARAARALRPAFALGRERFGFRVVQFSVQRTHVHIVAEADGARALARGVQGLSIRIARRLNRLMGRQGRVFADRYHARAVRSPRAVRALLLYVLQNARHHRWSGAPRPGRVWFDPYSSARWFEGWRTPHPRAADGGADPPPVVPARSWLLRSGWRRHGLLDPREAPADAAQATRGTRLAPVP